MGGISKQKSRERGAAFEVKCIKDTIILKEKMGKDASFEKDLLKSYKRYPEYKPYIK